MIPQSFIQDLLNRLDIVDVVERYVPLKKAGANYMACCPFHGEKTPSFSVSPTKQFYHCFGCGAHGTAISFVMEYQGLGFVEAVEDLARSAGMTVPQEAVAEKQRAAQSADLSEVMLQATRYYRDELKRAPKAIEYLKRRGLSGEVAARFGIGYAPPGWQSLRDVFPDYEAKSLVQAGLVIEGEGGKRYDRFRDRIMFPIINSRGAVIGFGGRVLDQGEPKYLNSPETPLFEKGQELYGLYQARKAIRDIDRVLVVEGYMDVVALAQHGIEYAVATLGTATTPTHVQKLLRQSDSIVFCFDGDAAGRKAAWRALENSLGQVADGKRLNFLFLPQGEDPDSYVRSAGKAVFEAMLGEALPLSQFLLRELTAQVDMQSQEGRAHLLQLARPLLLQVVAPALSLMLRKRLAELAGISQAELEALYQIKTAHKPRPLPRAQRNPPSLVRQMIQLLLVQPELAQGIDPELVEREGDESTLRALLDFLEVSPQLKDAAPIIEHFRGSVHEPKLRDAAAEIMQWEDRFAEGGIEEEFSGALAQLKQKVELRELEALKALARDQGLNETQKARLLQLLQSGRE
ncbi:MAG: DNA primase [Sulfurimicrobium sp.]|nr:DNA primase [Sulfurimicrobium sp.]MDP2198494.1 DNA primase [Sulfurimicrobium sp.]MDP2961342.1 DNA primase [Sulfurimicrobium sp.]MDP3688678.1 DNA primase [Sulfurimicrobium sp.]MDZ7657023.1 DNA primase [Sulfurimicrobium sp.]